MNNAKFEMVAKTFQGLEDVLRDELIELGAENVETGNRMVSFTGDNAMMYKANFCLRTALRILKPIVRFTAADTDELYDIVRDLDWEQFLTPDSTFAIESTVYGEEFTHSRFVTYRVKDGIADHFSDKYGRRPSIRVNGADIMLNVHIAGDRVTISLDSSGEPLNQRGYRVDAVAAPINEVLAAGIILKTGWRGDCDFVDPMCGSGTFLIEAALIAANIAPGIYRRSFAFERWKDFDAELFAEISADDSGERTFEHRIYGGDIDPDAVAIARRNVRQANLDSMIEIVCKSFDEWTTPPPEGILVTNPPYGERLRPENIQELYRSIGSTLKEHFCGYHAWIIAYQPEHFDAISLKPSVKYPLFNGSLECSLREYVLFNGKYSQFRETGGSVRNEDFNREARPKVRHLSDDEWEATTTVRRDNGERDRKRRADMKREFRRDDRGRGDDRKRSFRKDDDRKRSFRKDDDRKRSFRKDDDRKRPFRKDDDRKRPFRKDDDRKRPFRKDDDRRERQYRAKPAVELQNKQPKLPAESAIDLKVDGKFMRSRRAWTRKPAADADNDSTDNKD